jgi:hypothetical protein
MSDAGAPRPSMTPDAALGATAAASSPSTVSQSCTSNDLPTDYGDMYSAVIPGSSHVFQVQTGTIASGVVAWTASDPSMVQIDAQGLEAIITTLKAGTVTITASSGGKCGSRSLYITAATEAQWQAGNARYNNSNPLPNITTDGGMPSVVASALDPPGMPPACTNCHGDTATSNAFKTITETPVKTSYLSDQELISLVTQGTIPNIGISNDVVPSFLFSSIHKWSDISGNEAQAMVVYLRSLALQ